MDKNFEQSEAVYRFRSKLAVAESLVERNELTATEMANLISPVIEWLASKSELRILASEKLDIRSLNQCRDLLEKSLAEHDRSSIKSDKGQQR